MIVDFFRRGKGVSSGPLDYLLGKHRDREHATVLQGDVQEVAGLIDTSPYVKKYTAGCLSFYESDLEPEQNKKLCLNLKMPIPWHEFRSIPCFMGGTSR